MLPHLTGGLNAMVAFASCLRQICYPAVLAVVHAHVHFYHFLGGSRPAPLYCVLHLQSENFM